MHVHLYPHQWARLNLDNQENYNVARAAFYLGLGLEAADAYIHGPRTREERLDLESLATSLGMTELDVISRF